MERIGGYGLDTSYIVDANRFEGLSDTDKTEEVKSVSEFQSHRLPLASLEGPRNIEESISDTSDGTENNAINNDSFMDFELNFRNREMPIPLSQQDNIEERMRLLRQNFNNYNDSDTYSSDSSIQELLVIPRGEREERKIEYNQISIEEVKNLLQ